MNVKLVVEYDGTNYHGFQIQPNGNTIQEELEKAIKKILKDDFIIMSKEEVIKQGLYGPGYENKYYKDGLGDFFALGIGNKAIRWNNKTNLHKSAHSGLTLDEMLVPLIVVNSNKIKRW